MTVTTYVWTTDRYHQAVQAGVFDDQPVELLNGEIVVMSPEGIPHAGYSSDAANYLRRQLGDRALICEGHPITLSDRSEPEPDLAIVAPLQQVYKTQHHPYPEDVFWLVEYSDTSLDKDTSVTAILA
ncbi:MAG: Uma2 family endonuclease [Leptolyngbyaceae cyanobacterium SL_7_1]|nr:Uma2 family endonuclease [Leptolyngbyaceae cyanobacterium SL_7_1]